MVLTPTTIQQQRETPLVEVVNDDEDIFPNREIPHDGECNEHSYEENNPMTNSPKEFTDGLYPWISEQNSSFTYDSSPARSGKYHRPTLKQVIKDKVSRLEIEMNKSHFNALGVKEEIKPLNGELLVWVNRWQELKLKKDKYKAIKLSLAIPNK